MLHLTMPRIPMQNKLTELKQKISTLDSDEGIKVDSGKGTKFFLTNGHIIALVVKTVGKSFSIIEY